MYKKLFIFFSLFLLVGCNTRKQNDIYTKIEENNNIVIAINYPITHVSKLDNCIKNDINNIYNEFKNSYYNFHILDNKSELNIDYDYSILNERYISINIKIDIVSSSKTTHKIKTYLFDKKNNKFIKLNNIVNTDKLSTFIKTYLLNNYTNMSLDDINKLILTDTYNNFFIDYNYLRIYYIYDNIIEIKITLSELNLKITLSKQTFTEENEKIKVQKKVIDSSKKVIALTFDDGPSKYTKEIINYLNQNNACATFFILGNKVEIYKDTLKNMIKYGNEIGNHSYNHKWLTKLTINDYKSQINDTQKIIQDNLNYNPVLFRPTYGSVNNKIRNNTDLKIVLWNIDTRDWSQKNSKEIANVAIKKAYDGAIVLMHDTHKRTLDALKIIVPTLKKQGYQFVTVSELEEINLLKKNRN